MFSFVYYRFMTNIISKTVKLLSQSKIILYPTDTIWGIGCDATDEKAVAKVFKLKQRTEAKSLIILVDGMEMLQNYIEKFPAKVSCVLAGTSRPTSVIYKKPKGLAKNVIAADNTVAIRIANDEFCQKLIQKFGKPIVSTSANYSGKPAPKCFEDIDKTLLNKVDYVVNLHRDEKQNRSSQLVKISDKGRIEFLRK